MNHSILNYIKIFIISVLIVSACFSCSKNENKISIENLKCEYLVDPIGIDSPAPRFVWQISGNETGTNQTACEIIVGSDSLEVAAGKGNLWESGTIKSGNSLAIYSGNLLNPFTKYFWSVKIWDENGSPSKWSKIASFETGMMDSKNWRGDWISDTRDIDLKPAAWFRKEFTAAKTIQSARAYIAVGGLYELYVNGQKVGNHRLDPMYTRFDRRILYVAHDVTDLVSEGQKCNWCCTRKWLVQPPINCRLVFR
jgi:alpha-L-rhamnosidase